VIVKLSINALAERRGVHLWHGFAKMNRCDRDLGRLSGRRSTPSARCWLAVPPQARQAAAVDLLRCGGRLTAARTGVGREDLFRCPRSRRVARSSSVSPCSCCAPTVGRCRSWQRSSVCRRARCVAGVAARRRRGRGGPGFGRARKAAPAAARRQGARLRSVRLERGSGLLRLGEQDPVKVFGFALARRTSTRRHSRLAHTAAQSASHATAQAALCQCARDGVHACGSP
jgi:hypothetical protein